MTARQLTLTKSAGLGAVAGGFITAFSVGAFGPIAQPLSTSQLAFVVIGSLLGAAWSAVSAQERT